VWGAIGAYGKTKLYFFEENLNSDVYIKILKSRLKESQITYSSQGFEWKFLQDGHRAHKEIDDFFCFVLREHLGDRWLHTQRCRPISIQLKICGHILTAK